MIKRVLVGIVILTVFAQFATSEDFESFGSCFVETYIDDFTDEVMYHIIGCGDESVIGVACFPEGGLTSFIRVADKFLIEGSEVTVRFRFDKNTAYSNSWQADSNNRAYSYDMDLAEEIISQIQTSDSVLLEVDGMRGSANLGDSSNLAAEAIRNRCDPTEEEPVQAM